MSNARELADVVSTSPSTDINIDNGTLVVDISTDRVGIGTASPDTKLNIVQSSTGRSWSPTGGQGDLIVERNGNAGISIVGANGSTSNLNFGDTDDENAGFITYNHSDNSMSLRTNSSGTDLTIDSSGKVGIGITPSEGRLHVKEDGSGDVELLTLENSTGTGGKATLTLKTTSTDATKSAQIKAERVGGSGETDLEFYTFNGSSTTERMKIASGGDVTVSTGNLVIGTAGKGISFGGDPDSRINSATAASDGRTLYDYEEGSWTLSANSSNSWDAYYATYTKVGNIVTCGAFINNINTSDSTAYITMSLPFQSASDQRATGTLFHQHLNYSGTTPSLVVYVGGDATSASIYRVQDNGSYEIQRHSITSSSTALFFSITYRV